MASPNLRASQVQLYHDLIAISLQQVHGRTAIHIDKSIVSRQITIKVSPTCSCGRFFEQHPTSVEDLDEDNIAVFLKSILDGYCKCITSSDSTLSLQEVGKGFIHLAASLGSCFLVKHLVEVCDCDINDVTKVFHHTALSLAVMQTKNDLVQWLCDHSKIDLNIKSKNEKHTPLIDAMLAEKFQLVDILAKANGVDLNTTNFRMETPLVVAIRMNNVRLVRQLLMAGADHSIPSPDGTLTLHLATRAGRDIVQEFVDASVPLNNCDLNGESALSFSIRNRTLDVTDVLVRGGADPNVNPALPGFVLAASLGLIRTMAYLWERGQNPNQADTQGWTALHHASMKGYTTMANLLLSASASPDCLTPCDISPIGLAVFYRHSEIAESLLSHNCQVNVFDADLDTPLHYAARNGDVDIVRKLLDHGANAFSLNRIGVTPLYNAALSNNTTVVKILLPYYVESYLHFKSFGFHYDSWNSKRLMFDDFEKSILWIAANNGNLVMMNAIIYAGFNAMKEEWIHRRDFPEAVLLEEESKLISVLIASMSIPMSLMSSCRAVVRNVLGPGKHRKINQVVGVPRKMKNYIMLRDIDDI